MFHTDYFQKEQAKKKEEEAFVIFKCALVGEAYGVLTHTVAKWNPGSICISIMSAMFTWKFDKPDSRTHC